jgi:hypothetical protein
MIPTFAFVKIWSLTVSLKVLNYVTPPEATVNPTSELIPIYFDDIIYTLFAVVWSTNRISSGSPAPFFAVNLIPGRLFSILSDTTSYVSLVDDVILSASPTTGICWSTYSLVASYWSWSISMSAARKTGLFKSIRCFWKSAIVVPKYISFNLTPSYDYKSSVLLASAATVVLIFVSSDDYTYSICCWF